MTRLSLRECRCWRARASSKGRRRPARLRQFDQRATLDYAKADEDVAVCAVSGVEERSGCLCGFHVSFGTVTRSRPSVTASVTSVRLRAAPEGRRSPTSVSPCNCRRKGCASQRRTPVGAFTRFRPPPSTCRLGGCSSRHRSATLHDSRFLRTSVAAYSGRMAGAVADNGTGYRRCRSPTAWLAQMESAGGAAPGRTRSGSNCRRSADADIREEVRQGGGACLRPAALDDAACLDQHRQTGDDAVVVSARDASATAAVVEESAPR